MPLFLNQLKSVTFSCSFNKHPRSACTAKDAVYNCNVWIKDWPLYAKECESSMNKIHQHLNKKRYVTSSVIASIHPNHLAKTLLKSQVLFVCLGLIHFIRQVLDLDSSLRLPYWPVGMFKICNILYTCVTPSSQWLLNRASRFICVKYWRI